MDTLNFNFIFLGQSVLKYEVPLDVYDILNHIYETRRSELPKANPQLVGKIQAEIIVRKHFTNIFKTF